MCRLYGSGNSAFVRACYATGHRGAHIPVAQVVWGVGHHHILLGTRTTRTIPPPSLHVGLLDEIEELSYLKEMGQSTKEQNDRFRDLYTRFHGNRSFNDAWELGRNRANIRCNT